MNYKHIIFINGQYVTIWGPYSRMNTLVLFLRAVAKQYNQDYYAISFGLQLTEECPMMKDPAAAYWAWQYIYSYINQKKCNITLKHNDFLSSSPVSLLPTPPPANKAPTVLDLLTEIVVSQRKSSLAGTISVPLKSRRWWEVLAFQRLMPQPPIIISALVTIAVFGFLLLPIH
jgi:hypothetical protein